jgi:peptidoglycan/LPS O-acetylase OafA/YrhL
LLDFYIRRFARIAPLLYFMLVFQLAQLWFVYGQSRSPSEIMLNIVFLFNFSPRLINGIVPASWSIGVEMIFYFILPGVLILARGYVGSIALLLVSLMLATEFSAAVLAAKDLNEDFAHHGIATQMPYFCFGLLALHAYRTLAPAGQLQKSIVAGALYLLVPLGLWCLIFRGAVFAPLAVGPVNIMYNSMFGLPFAFLVIAISLRPILVLVNPVTMFWGRVSFSLYLVHPNIIYFLHKAGLYQSIGAFLDGHTSLTFLVSAMITIMIISAVSWLTFTFIEAPGMKLGRRVVQRGFRNGILVKGLPDPVRADPVSAKTSW